ncbi:FadR/GntR family transcriptional regulator [Sphingomonas sp. Leaf4]|uniref:FadR/GntR family transcriptional regulator n=1 Tax=Sphingomonas sp. Leaf4 TaxID=2876553 RepID=UPI001E50D76F|nr:FadR/GntR family transcriptional regulator [Sphingomonas sp. Leaf4]
MNDAGNYRLYVKVSADIARQITEGDYAIGARLPPERVLAQTYGVSRPTVREAIIALEVDGMVEVRMGSGVYVVASVPRGGIAAYPDMGPFEVLEARRAVEGEVATIAAGRITPDALAELDGLLAEMAAAEDYQVSERADRDFHLAIARATGNSGFVAVIDMLWQARNRSPQYLLMSEKAHAAGVFPRHDEHVAILDALRSGDGARAGQAMRGHITRVLESFMHATEINEVERMRQRFARERERFLSTR